MHVLFLEVAFNPYLLELPDCLQQDDGIPGKAGHRFGDDKINLTLPAVL